MPDRSNKYNLVGFILASIFYLIVLSLLAFYLQDQVRKNINFTLKKDNLLDITLVERKSKKITKPIKKITKKKEIIKPKPIAAKPKPQKIAPKVQKKVSLQGLFKKIDTKKIIEQKIDISQQTRKKEIKSKKSIEKPIKKEVAKKLVESLSFTKVQNIKSSKNGVYDKFRGKVQQILYENWQNTIDTVSGNSATVEISIDKLGTFSYKIVKLSYNDEFNSKLVDFLEEMKDKEFPPFTEGEIFQLQVEFKDIRND